MRLITMIYQLKYYLQSNDIVLLMRHTTTAKNDELGVPSNNFFHSYNRTKAPSYSERASNSALDCVLSAYLDDYFTR